MTSVDNNFFKSNVGFTKPDAVKKPGLEPKLPSGAAVIANACGDTDFAKFFSQTPKVEDKATNWYA